MDSPSCDTVFEFMSDVTRILLQVESGDPNAAEQLLPLVYQELRRLAAAKLAHEKPGQTLQATALVHEAYLRLVDVDTVQQWDSRGHFFAAAAEAMRRILVESARAKLSQKRGGERARLGLSQIDIPASNREDWLVDLDEALHRLEQEHPRRASVVKLRYFAGLTIPEIAQVLQTSTTTVDSDWAYARAWLKVALKK
jgi:RNA polymerase sigma factor (TIGR02999 family)